MTPERIEREETAAGETPRPLHAVRAGRLSRRRHYDVPGGFFHPFGVALAGGGVALMLGFVPLAAFAQVAGVVPSADTVAILGLLDALKAGGSLGVAALSVWWANKKDQAVTALQAARVQDAKDFAGVIQAANEARLVDAKASNSELLTAIYANTKATEGLTRIVAQLAAPRRDGEAEGVPK